MAGPEPRAENRRTEDVGADVMFTPLTEPVTDDTSMPMNLAPWHAQSGSDDGFGPGGPCYARPEPTGWRRLWRWLVDG